MANPLTAELVTGHSPGARMGRPPWVRKAPNGMEGKQWWRVPNCDDPDAALEAFNLPTMGGAWSSRRPNLLCVTLQSDYVGGTCDGATGVGGLCLVEAGFSTPGEGSLPAPTSGLSYTYFVGGVETFQRVWDARADEDAGPQNISIIEPIMMGRGAECKRGNATARVVVYYTPEQFAAVIGRLMLLNRKHRINAEPITLPPVLRTSARFNFEPGQVQYSNFETPQEAIVPGSSGGSGTSLIKVTHVLAISPDFDFRWQSEDQYGRLAGGTITSKLYLPADLGGLW